MKKLRFLPVLAIILASASAFTFSKQDPLYYTLDGEHFEVISGGTGCDPGSFNCQYEAKVEEPDLDDPEDFEAVGDPMSVWNPGTK
jgi:hypothetical protein